MLLWLAMPWILIAAVIAILLWLYWRWDRPRYRGTPGAGLRPTDEVFRDPVSGQLMRVYEDPATGQRDYRPEK